MTVEVTVSTTGDVQVLGAALSNLRPALDGLGALLTQRAQAAFRQQRRGNVPWPPRMVPNVPGIIRDLNAGGFPKGRRFEPRPALVDTGTPRRSITWEVAADGKSVVVGTDVPYASLHNEGGESTVKLTPTGRQQLSVWLRRSPENREFGLGFLFSQPEITIQVRKRPFLDIGAEDRKFIVKTLEEALGESVRIKRRGRR